MMIDNYNDGYVHGYQDCRDFERERLPKEALRIVLNAAQKEIQRVLDALEKEGLLEGYTKEALEVYDAYETVREYYYDE